MDERGRPTKWSPELQEKLCSFLEQGTFIQDACALCDIDPNTYTNWMNWGKEGEEPYSGFFRAVTKARSKPMRLCAEAVLAAARQPKTWQAASWFLRNRKLVFGEEDQVAGTDSGIPTADDLEGVQ